MSYLKTIYYPPLWPPAGSLNMKFGWRGWHRENVFKSWPQLLPGWRSRVGQDTAELVYHKVWKGSDAKIINPQSFSVNRMARHMKDLYPCHSVNTLEEDSDTTTTSKNRVESLLLDDKYMKSGSYSEERTKAEPSFCLCEEAPNENDHCQAATLVIIRSWGECCERNNVPQSSKQAQTCLVCMMPTDWKIWPFLELQFIRHLSCVWWDKICNIFKFGLIKTSIKRGICQLQAQFWALWATILQKGLMKQVKRNLQLDLVFNITNWSDKAETKDWSDKLWISFSFSRLDLIFRITNWSDATITDDYFHKRHKTACSFCLK